MRRHGGLSTGLILLLLVAAVPTDSESQQLGPWSWQAEPIFAGIEVAAWAIYLERRSAGGALRDDYRDFAWEVGRLQVGTRVDGDFNYYETLSTWNRSGAFDSDETQSGLQPEEAPETFNGTIWLRAQGIFLGDGGQPGDPGFAQARARLGELISESDSRFRKQRRRSEW